MKLEPFLVCMDLPTGLSNLFVYMRQNILDKKVHLGDKYIKSRQLLVVLLQEKESTKERA